jgi:hypothetical protein
MHGDRTKRLLPVVGFIFLWAAAASLTGLAGSGLAAGTPQVNLPETAYNFGKVSEEQPLSHTFIVRNTGDARLEIRDVDPDCNCTVPRYDRTIAPGGQGEITLTIKPYSVLKQFKKETKVMVNDPERPEVVLTLTGESQPIIEIQPSHIIRFRGSVAGEMAGKVRFISHLSGPWEISQVTTNIPDKIAVSLKAEEPGRVYVLEVRNLSQEAGHYAGRIELSTTSAKRPRLLVRVFADLYPPSAVVP